MFKISHILDIHIFDIVLCFRGSCKKSYEYKINRYAKGYCTYSLCLFYYLTIRSPHVHITEKHVNIYIYISVPICCDASTTRNN